MNVAKFPRNPENDYHSLIGLAVSEFSAFIIIHSSSCIATTIYAEIQPRLLPVNNNNNNNNNKLVYRRKL